MDKDEELRQWFSHADADLFLAEHGLSLYPIPDEPICCLCQQSAEKYLKAFLFLNDIEPPKIHQLLPLLEMCSEIVSDFDELERKCRFLAKFAVIPRYPNELQITKDDSKVAVKFAKEIKEYVLNKVKDNK
jgi:HEPN domain-containing protein